MKTSVIQKCLGILFFLLSLCPENTFAQNEDDPEISEIDSIFAKYNITEQSPGIALVLVKDGHVVSQRCLGMANLEYRQPITPNTIFDLASLSKQFTGMAISMLVEQGKISLDEDIRTYIPEMPDFGHTITINHLLHHTSGLRDWTNTFSLAGKKLEDIITYRQILDMTFNQKDLNYIPGAKYSYTNTGYNLLVELICRVTGRKFSEWTKNNIFSPLGMNNTCFVDNHSTIFPKKAYSYYNQNGEFHLANNGTSAFGSSSLFSTIEDMAKWVIELDNPSVFGKSVVDRMSEKGILNDGSRISYAFGLLNEEYNGFKRLSHRGFWVSYNTYMANFPEVHLSIVVLMNTPANVLEIAHEVANIYLGPYFAQTTEETDQARKRPEFIELSENVLDDYTGTYVLDSLNYYIVSKNKNHLVVNKTFEGTTILNPISDTIFLANGNPISFYKDSSGETIKLKTNDRSFIRAETRSRSLDEFTGTYYSEELQTTYTLFIEEDKLIAKHLQNGKISLSDISDKVFKGSKWYMELIRFYTDEDDEISGFYVSSVRAKNQRFIKH